MEVESLDDHHLANFEHYSYNWKLKVWTIIIFANFEHYSYNWKLKVWADHLLANFERYSYNWKLKVWTIIIKANFQTPELSNFYQTNFKTQMDKPPILKTWKNLYGVVIGFIVFLIAVFTIITYSLR